MHVIESLGSGGAERLLYTNLRYLDSAQIESTVVTVSAEGEYWREPIEQLGVRVANLDCPGYTDVPTGIARLKGHISEMKPDIIHTHLFLANIIGRCAGRLAGLPVISSIHNPEYEPEASAGASPGVKRKIGVARLTDKFTARFCKRMIAVSNYVKQSTVSRLGYPASKIDVLYNPIDFSEVGKSSIDREAVLQSVGLSADSVLLLHVGRLSSQKGLVDAVRAMPQILSSVPTAHLVSVGAHADADYKSMVVDAINSLGVSGAVHLPGERRDVAALLSACDIFLFPSRFEGLGIAIVEAMAAGKACIASDIVPLTEFIKHDVNGVLTAPGDSDAIAKSVVQLLRDPEKSRRLGNAARDTALREFDPSAAAEKLTEIYISAAEPE
jgi:glycosyltransferase involved in cell wall biosynthesis